MSNDEPCPHHSIVQLEQGDKITTQCTRCGKKMQVRQKAETDTPRTDDRLCTISIENEDSCCAIYVKIDGKDSDCELIDADFTRQLERELTQSKAEVERLKSNKNYWANLWVDLSRESIKRAEKSEAEVERLRHLLTEASYRINDPAFVTEIEETLNPEIK